MASRLRIIREEDDEGRLRLGLGPVDKHPQLISDPSQLRTEHELGLGLGYSNDGIGTEPPPSSYHERWLQPLGSSSSSSSSSSPATLPFLRSSASLSPWIWPLHGDFSRNPLRASQKREVGVWFCLRSCSSRGWDKEALPQVPKAYIRLKDGSATVLMVKNYLVRKLGLSSELEDNGKRNTLSESKRQP
ncbi:uncharacterized protein [Aristolochia californica]|uniref:uncharacterized protein n=1 Tax=Aristolochia californica TaxID=171875 RepID=UPI0035D9F1E6